MQSQAEEREREGEKLDFWVRFFSLTRTPSLLGFGFLEDGLVRSLDLLRADSRAGPSPGVVKMRGKSASTSNYFVLNTGARIPAIGLGTWQCGGDLCIEAVRTALRIGYRHIDCAHLYGNEIEVGKALAEAFDGGLKREDVFLTSKLYCATNSHKRIENSVRVSLKSLGVAYLDLYLVHWPECSAFGDATDPPWKTGSEYRQMSHAVKPTWKAMEGLVEKGLVRAIGVSNFTVQQISELLQFAKIVPAVNQVLSISIHLPFLIHLMSTSMARLL
ncbi:hypothetical protein Taro_039433 [Colocasia esculenta]|uniref:NADP-dependent oxidoreductase domain-containing protein n=1 Tax=Colocasia esculenta TaxID=4460 RepID=A0A843WQ65_COLES|nr:hypothetical protein [Colocasia esculenta]